MLWSVYILAGGASSRFGSDKARAVVHGEAMLTRVARLAGPFSRSVTVVADRGGKYDNLSLTTIADLTRGQGPLGGLATAMAHRGEGWLVLLSCDLLVLSPEWVETLAAARDPDTLAAAFRHEKWEPLLALYHTDARSEVASQLATGRRSMQAFFARLAERAAAAPLPADWPAKLQANRPQDLR